MSNSSYMFPGNNIPVCEVRFFSGAFEIYLDKLIEDNLEKIEVTDDNQC